MSSHSPTDTQRYKTSWYCAAGRRQYFYIALLWDNEWLYATIPNISNTFDDEDGTVLWEDKPEWTAIESRLENFEPKSFSAAIKAASAFTRKRNQSHQAASSTLYAAIRIALAADQPWWHRAVRRTYVGWRV